MSSWNNPGGYNNGYAPNAGIQLESVVTDIITNSLNQISRSNSYPGPVLDETYKRLMNNVVPICNNIEKMFTNGNRQIDSNAVSGYLQNNDIINTLNATMQEYQQRMAYHNSMNGPFGYNGGYGGMNNNYGYNNYNPGYNRPNYPSNVGMFNSMPNTTFGGPVSTGNAASNSGIGRLMKEQEYKNTCCTPTNPNPQNTGYSSTFTNNNNATNNATIAISRAVAKDIFKNFIDQKERRANKLSIDKLTSDTSSVLDNKEFMTNHIGDPDIPTIEIVAGNASMIDSSSVVNTIVETPDSPEYCDIVAMATTTDKGTSVDTANFELLVPVVNTKEAIDLVRDAAPSFVSQDNWISTICYKELVCRKITGFGIHAKNAFKEIQNNLSKIKSLNDITNVLVPIIKKQPQEVKEYIEALLFDRINKLLKMSVYNPNDPTQYPIVPDWAAIYELIDKRSRDIPFINTMYNEFSDEYPETVYLCVKSAFVDIFDNEDDVVVSVNSETEPNDNNLGLVAKLPEVTAIVGKYRMSDYGYIPENYKKTLFDKFEHDYIVHKYEQDILVTNIDVSVMLGSASKYTVVNGFTNLPQLVIGGLTKLMKERGDLVNMPLIQLDRTGEEIIGTYTFSIGMDGSILITKV